MSKKSVPHRSRKRKGFSLLELLAVVTILGILAVIVVPRIGIHGQAAKRNSCLQYKGDLNAAIERYHWEHDAWPADTNTLEAAGIYPQAIPKCPVDNSDYTIDASTHRISGHNH